MNDPTQPPEAAAPDFHAAFAHFLMSQADIVGKEFVIEHFGQCGSDLAAELVPIDPLGTAKARGRKFAENRISNLLSQ